jgi:hypothetical protein
MDGGPRWRRRAEGRRWRRIRPAAMFAAAGTVLTLLTMVLGISNAISVQQVIALALVAAVTTLGGVIRVTVPDTWIAWRRGFQQGCEVAMTCEASHPTVKAGPDTIPPRSGEPTVTDLHGRSGTRSGRRISLADGS